MKNKCLIYILIITIILSMVFILAGCDEQNKTKEKVEQEVGLIENRLISIINGLNNIKFENYVLTQIDIPKEDSKSENSGTQKSGSQTGQSSEGGGSSEGEQNSSGGSQQSEGSSGSGSSGEEKSNIQYSMQEQSMLENNQEIDWTSIKNEVENLYTIWSSMIVDLHSVNVNNDDILNFSNQLDDLIIDVQNENKANTASMIANLYAYIPKYTEHYTEESININLSYAKANVIASYALIERDDWEKAKQAITMAQEYFTNMINNTNKKNIDNQSKLSKSYVLLGEFNNCVDKKDKQLYYIKYKNLMENIESI